MYSFFGVCYLTDESSYLCRKDRHSRFITIITFSSVTKTYNLSVGISIQIGKHESIYRKLLSDNWSENVKLTFRTQILGSVFYINIKSPNFLISDLFSQEIAINNDY